MAGGDPAGGSAALAELIDKYGELLLPDFQQFYHINLVRAFEPGSGWSPRTILVLVRGLPIESRFVAERRGGPQFMGWTVDRYLNASLIDAVQANTYWTMADKVKGKPPKPEPVWRPDDAEAKKKRPNQFAAIAARRLAAAKKAQGGSSGD